jgi:hypothetical protein
MVNVVVFGKKPELPYDIKLNSNILLIINRAPKVIAARENFSYW